MATYLARRLGIFLLTLASMSVIVFWITEIAPGNIAYNNLGNLITPEQEASFNAQYGLDDPAWTRYRRWVFGSDRQAARLIGKPVQRYRNDVGRSGWWAVADDGTLFRSFIKDGETIMRRELQADETVVVTHHPEDTWTINEDGVSVFWGVNSNNNAAMWVRGDTEPGLNFKESQWVVDLESPRDYLPLQSGLLRGDPGISINDKQPVTDILSRRVLNSAILAGVSFVLIMPAALLLGVIAALNEGRRLDRILSFLGIITTMTPQFVSGVFLIIIFAFWLKWLPGATIIRPGSSLLSQPKLLVLPVLTLTMAELGYILRITRASMIEVLGTNYIRTAELKGLSRRRVVMKHALQNALLAPLTIMMLHVNYLIGGLVIVEQIFGFPGLGRYLLEAAFTKDVFAVEAGTMLLLLIATLSQLVSDIVYTFLNPRIRFN